MKTTIAGIAASVLLAITMPALANGIVLVDPSATADRSKPDVEACYNSAQAQTARMPVWVFQRFASG